jgi:hypothetical protein
VLCHAALTVPGAPGRQTATHTRARLSCMHQAALQQFDPNLDPGEAALPLTRVPGLGIPSLVPIPNLQR